MPTTAPELTLIDLEHLGERDSVTAYLLESSEGPVIVDPGPAATLPRLRTGLEQRGYQLGDLRALLLTHIHLDHAGASGTLARANPKLVVHVHEKGAPHLAEPSKLVNSATRLYGDRMEALWGEILPVPMDQINVVSGGELLSIGGLNLEVAYTPGHAWHHVSYLDRRTGVAFVGDTAGLRGPRVPVILPVTPPPDFDLSAWLESIDRILLWQPNRIALTHFGTWSDPAQHFAALREGLLAWAGYAKETLTLPGSDEDRVRFFVERLHQWIEGRAPTAHAASFLGAAGPEACWQGLARYWRTAS